MEGESAKASFCPTMFFVEVCGAGDALGASPAVPADLARISDTLPAKAAPALEPEAVVEEEVEETPEEAPVDGEENATPLAAPIAHIVATSDGRGYWLVAADGGVFAFGDAAYGG